MPPAAISCTYLLRSCLASTCAVVPRGGMAPRRRQFHQRPDAQGQRDAAAGLLTMLQTEYAKGEISANMFGELANESWAAGAQSDELRAWGMPTGSGTGHFQRRIDTQIKELSISKVDTIALNVPGQTHQNRRRYNMRVEARPMHELLHEEVCRTTTSRADAKRA
eukprot:6211567-Pyramimonas_sp.AAC.1